MPSDLKFGTEPIYIDEHINVFEGPQAATRLASRQVAVDPETGVSEVNWSRWEEAQRYERKTWMVNARRGFTDRNEYHRERFANYSALRGRRFARAIELGCGPFTNMRYILEQCDAQTVHLLDPLLTDYLTHPFCKYARHRLGGTLNERVGRLGGYLRHPWVACRSKVNDWRIGGLFGTRVRLEPTPIEKYLTQDVFDLVVMINVLEHCQSATAIFNTINHILGAHGILIYHDKMYAVGEVKELLAVCYDAGHPLRVDKSVVDRFLSAHFKPLMRAEYLAEFNFRGRNTTYREVYFIGEKLSSQGSEPSSR